MNTTISFLQSDRVILRALTQEDLTEEYLQWLNDEEVCRNNSHAVFPNTVAKMHKFYEAQQNHMAQVVLAIIHKADNIHIGNVSLQGINWISRNAEFAILMGNKEYWGKGYGEEAAKLIVSYGFERLNLHRIYCGTLAGNEGMIRLASRLKMQREGVRRQAIFKQGNYADIIEFGVLKNEFYSL